MTRTKKPAPTPIPEGAEAYFWFQKAGAFFRAYPTIDAAIAGFIATDWRSWMGNPEAYEAPNTFGVHAIKHDGQLFFRISLAPKSGKATCRSMAEVREAADWFDDEWADNYSFMRGEFDEADLVLLDPENRKEPEDEHNAEVWEAEDLDPNTLRPGLPSLAEPPHASAPTVPSSPAIRPFVAHPAPALTHIPVPACREAQLAFAFVL